MSHYASEIAQVVKRFSSFVDELSPYAPQKEDSFAELVALYVQLNGVTGDREDNGLVGMLRDLSRDVGFALNSQMRRPIETHGDYELEKHAARYTETWDHPAAASEVATASFRRLATERDGEVTATEAVDQVVNDLLACGSFSRWRIGESESRGIGIKKFLVKDHLTAPAGVVVRRSKEASE